MKFQLPGYVLFDLDGTLLDSFPGIEFSVNEACRIVGIPKPRADLRALLGPPIRVIFSKAVATDDASLLDKLETAFRVNYDTEGWMQTTCFENAETVLRLLKTGGHRLFVVSNKPRHISLRILEHQELSSFFERIYTQDSRIPPYISKEDMLRGFLQEYSVPASDCLMVGDTIEDVTASAANQINVALMEHGYGEVATVVPVQFRFRSFSDFLARMVMENTK